MGEERVVSGDHGGAEAGAVRRGGGEVCERQHAGLELSRLGGARVERCKSHGAEQLLQRPPGAEPRAVRRDRCEARERLKHV